LDVSNRVFLYDRPRQAPAGFSSARRAASAYPWFSARIEVLDLTLHSDGSFHDPAPGNGDWPALLNREGLVQKLFSVGGNHGVGDLRLFDGPEGAPTEVIVADWFPYGSPRELAKGYADSARRGEYETKVGHRGTIDNDDFFRKVGLVGPAMLWELERAGASNARLSWLNPNGSARSTDFEDRLPALRKGSARDLRVPAPRKNSRGFGAVMTRARSGSTGQGG
jgi:hypothetical protein